MGEVLTEEKKEEKAIAVVEKGDAHPIELRLGARDQFLAGRSFQQIAEALHVHKNTVFGWATNGHWRELREELARDEERRQISRVRASIAGELSLIRERVAYLDNFFMESLAWQPETIPDGEGRPPLKTGLVVPRTPAERIVSVGTALEGLFKLTDDRMQFLELVGKLLGNLPSKVDPAQLDLTRLPNIVVPPPAGVAPQNDDTPVEPAPPLAGGDDSNGQPN